ncbi:helix-turn-helix domain-containing protein [Lysobacter sp. A6]|uniref:Helix-turn-helix domain-containing protein n=1 Tax=Noviluteimonas lactosilytica TaxID=2888523 RepID=A0ABS8JGA3_9GAMM|nr:helix-turn-helix domain-containing protein [Lysobacter lactosilyticus]MCC8362648.1 helix-turn-helix domain-containing protein [Lysobacter lactosilyticus]
MKISNSTSRSHAIRPKPLPVPLDQPGRLRVGHLMYLYGCSHSTVYAYLKCGRIPPADGKDGRRYWLTSTIRPLFEQQGGAS